MKSSRNGESQLESSKMENCSLSDKNVCLLCETVTASEAELDAHIGEQHSDFFAFNFQIIGKYEDNENNNENTLSLDTKSRRLDVQRRVLSVRRSQLDVKNSQVPVKSILFDLQNGQLELEKSALDLKCTKCDIQEADEKSTETVNDKKAFKCKKCVKIEAKKCVKIEANIDQTNQDRVVCQICKKEYKNMICLLAHHKNVHMKDKVECQRCEKILSSQASLNIHMNHVHGEKKFRCAKTEANKDQTNRDRVVCQICNKDLKNKYVLLAHHNNMHSPKDKVFCQICKKDFKTKNALLAHHNNVHTMKDKVLCQECAKTLPSEASLNSHMKHVHGEKMYQCHPCGIFFGQKINLQKHIVSFHCLNNTKVCFQCEKNLILNVFPKKSRKMIDGQLVSICSYCIKRNKSNELS